MTNPNRADAYENFIIALDFRIEMLEEAGLQVKNDPTFPDELRGVHERKLEYLYELRDMMI